MTFTSSNGGMADQVQQWIAQNPQFAQAVAAAMAGTPAVRYQPIAGNSPNWGGRNTFSTSTSVPVNMTGTPPSGLLGRIVSSPAEIKPSDIPMDGSAAIFPMTDDSCIYAKCWAADGGIKTIRYVPEKTPEEIQNQGPSEFDQVMTRLDKIEQMIGQGYQNRKQQYWNRNTQGNRNNAVDSQMNAKDYIDNVNRTEATN